MSEQYLAPWAIVKHGFENSKDGNGKQVKQATIVRELADRRNCKPAYIYSWGRESGEADGATGEENPINWFEQLQEFFFSRCREAAILMVARVQYKHKELMGTVAIEKRMTSAELRQKAIDLQALLHYAIESGDDNRLAVAFAAYQSFGEKGLQALNGAVAHTASAEFKRELLEAEREAEQRTQLAKNKLVRALEMGA